MPKKENKTDLNLRRLKYLKSASALLETLNSQSAKDQYVEYYDTYDWMISCQSPISSIAPTTLEKMEARFRKTAIELEDHLTDEVNKRAYKAAVKSSEILQAEIKSQYFKGVKRI